MIVQGGKNVPMLLIDHITLTLRAPILLGVVGS